MINYWESTKVLTEKAMINMKKIKSQITRQLFPINFHTWPFTKCNNKILFITAANMVKYLDKQKFKTWFLT